MVEPSWGAIIGALSVLVLISVLLALCAIEIDC